MLAILSMLAGEHETLRRTKLFASPSKVYRSGTETKGHGSQGVVTEETALGG
jgi:hypothetical protein